MCPGRQVPGHITWLTTSARRPLDALIGAVALTSSVHSRSFSVVRGTSHVACVWAAHLGVGGDGGLGGEFGDL